MDAEHDTLYTVVMNEEEQYSIWIASRPLPPGWVKNGPTASKEECLKHIETVWTDMRPLSLRKQMDAAQGTPRT
jgi:MbtH protein